MITSSRTCTPVATRRACGSGLRAASRIARGLYANSRLLRSPKLVCLSSEEPAKTADEAPTTPPQSPSTPPSLASASEPPSSAPPSAPPGSEAASAGSESATSSIHSHPIGDFFGTDELISELQDSNAGHRGEALFLVQVITLILIVAPPIQFHGLVHLMGILALTAGAVFLVYSLICLGKNISPMPTPRKSHKLVTTGMYGIVRHPMYGGLLMACFGVSALSLSETRLALTLLLWFVLEMKIKFEESALQSRYPEYEDYQKRVKKFIPMLY